MARDEAPPFARGKTWYSGGTIDSNDLGAPWLEGKEWRFEDVTYNTGMYVTCRVVRNVGAAALLPKRLVSWKAGYYGRRVDGYTTTTNAQGYPVDELLPAAGVPVNDLFYIVTQGPCLVLTDLAGAANNVITEGDPLSALTAATSGATTSGRARTVDLTGATAPLGNGVLSVFGRAMSAKTTANSNADLLVYVHGTF